MSRTPDATRWRLQRVYEPVGDADGVRVLVDRVWPRGMARDDPRVGVRDADVAPSTGLRSWYGHDPARFAEFARRYNAELDASGAAEALAGRMTGHPVVTLVVGAKDVGHSQGAVLLERLRSG